MGTGARRPFGLRLARVHGIPVYIGRSWPLIALVVVLFFGPTVPVGSRPLGYAVAGAYALLLLLSVLAHEAGHAVVARAFGARVDRVVADLWGGHTVFESEQLRPGATAAVAVAGPGVNLVVAAVGWAALGVVDVPVAQLLVGAVVVTNAFVGGFNLLPGLPLDGGFVVDALVWKLTGDRARGLLVAGWLGRGVTLVVAGWFLLVPLLQGRRPSLFTLVWVALLGAFLWAGATQAVRAGSARRTISAVPLRQVLRPVTGVPAHASAAAVVRALLQAPSGARAVLLSPAGGPMGFVDPAALGSVPPGRRDEVPALSLLRRPPDGWVVSAGPGDDAFRVARAFTDLDAAGAAGHPVLVVDDAGRLLGAVDVEDLGAALLRR